MAIPIPAAALDILFPPPNQLGKSETCQQTLMLCPIPFLAGAELLQGLMFCWLWMDKDFATPSER